ncbi:MAG: GntR family transcriptional regulator [Spirochaetes bacterium]|nr:GntR family transcriptional regulator [Spirochaetota bacterium]
MAFKITLDNASGVPYYRQIVNQVIYGIVNGLLQPGTQLPTVRQLAVDLQVNLNTITKAYRELEIKGIVDTQQGTGTFISDKKIIINPSEKNKLLRSKCIYFIDEISSLGIDLNDAIEMFQKISAEREEYHVKKIRKK